MCWPDDPWQDIRPNVPDGAALTPALAITAAALRAYASAIEAATAGETVKLGSTEGESAVGATSAETPTLSSPRRG